MPTTGDRQLARNRQPDDTFSPTDPAGPVDHGPGGSTPPATASAHLDRRGFTV